MDNHSTNHSNKAGLFTTLYRARVVVKKGETTIVNLSVLFLIVTLFAPWLLIIGVIAALALGYRFSFVRNSTDFEEDLSRVVRSAANNVKNAVENVKSNKNDTSEQETQDAQDEQTAHETHTEPDGGAQA